MSAIKKAYFALARRFHPDLFYRQVDKETHKRIQQAFTEIAQAYETLKDEETREVYDFKLKKVLDQLREAEAFEKAGIETEDMDLTGHIGMAAENFNTGYDYLLKDKIDACLPFLGRAVLLDDKNARYHAFYGRALAFDPDSHRKAEGEIANGDPARAQKRPLPHDARRTLSRNRTYRTCQRRTHQASKNRAK